MSKQSPGELRDIMLDAIEGSGDVALAGVLMENGAKL